MVGRQEPSPGAENDAPVPRALQGGQKPGWGGWGGLWFVRGEEIILSDLINCFSTAFMVGLGGQTAFL